MSTLTVLDLDAIGLPDGAARGISQTLDPISAKSQARRTVNGELIDLSAPQFRKYRSSITCSDQVPPALDGVWQGDVLTVQCIVELSYKTAGGSPGRSVVTGSSRTDGDYTFYRPELEMMVLAFSLRRDEYGAIVGWSLELEEI